MNKAELVAAVSERMGESKTKAQGAVDAVFEVIIDTLKKGDEVRLPSFGVFAVVKTAPRKARNPQTNEEVPVPAGYRARFKAGKVLKDSLNDSKFSAPTK